MKTTKWLMCAAALAATQMPFAPRSQAGLFKLDLAANQNDADGVTLADWDVIGTWTFADFPDGVAKWKLTDWSTDKDSDVTLTILDNEDLSAQNGWGPAVGDDGE